MNDYSELINSLKRYGDEITCACKFYIKEDIPAAKINNALRTFAAGADSSNVIGMIDTTITGSGKEGIVFTNTGMYVKEMLEKPEYIKYCDIDNVDIENLNKKKDCDKVIDIYDKNRNIFKISSTLLNKTPLYHFLTKAKDLSEQGKTNKTDKFLILEDMGDGVKESYLKIIVNFTYVDNTISAIELSNIYSLMTRIRTSADIRKKIMQYISEEKEYIAELLCNLDKEAPESSVNVLHLSLIKDLLKMARIKSSSAEEEKGKKDFIDFICSRYGISEEQVKFMKEALEVDEKFLSGEIDDDKYTKLMGDVASKAAAVGVPVAALYLSGSVVGLSAAGITSGLAALGLGGILGLSSMVTGVGVLVIAGVAAYSGIKWFTGRKSRDKENKREFLMQEAIKLNQETINNLIEDINNLTDELMDTVSQNEINEKAIQRLKKKLILYSNAFKQTRKNGADIEKSVEIEIVG